MTEPNDSRVTPIDDMDRQCCQYWPGEGHAADCPNMQRPERWQYVRKGDFVALRNRATGDGGEGVAYEVGPEFLHLLVGDRVQRISWAFIDEICVLSTGHYGRAD